MDKNKHSSDMNEEIIEILQQYKFEHIPEKQAINELLVLFNVVGRSEQLPCDHEWKFDSFDQWGFPNDKYCENCGKREAV